MKHVLLCLLLTFSAVAQVTSIPAAAPGGGGETTNPTNSGTGAAVLKTSTNVVGRTLAPGSGGGVDINEATDEVELEASPSVARITTGVGAPTGANTAGRDFYLDSTNIRYYRGLGGTSWGEVARISSGFGAPSASACDAAAEAGALYYRTDNTSGAGGHYGCAQTGSGTYAWVLLSGSGAVTASSTDTFTNKTLDAEGSGNIVTAPSQIYLEAGGCQNTTASLAWNTNATGPGSSCAGTNATEGTADFDAATDEGMHRRILLPDDFTGTVDAALVAFAAATTGTARVGINIDCSASTEDFDPAITNATTFNFTPSGTTNRPVVTTQTGITITGCAANELARIRLYRDADGTSGTDDMTGDLRVIGLRLKIRRAM